MNQRHVRVVELALDERNEATPMSRCKRTWRSSNDQRVVELYLLRIPEVQCADLSHSPTGTPSDQVHGSGHTTFRSFS